MSWTDTNWCQSDDFYNGYPLPTDTNVFYSIDENNLYTVWNLDGTSYPKIIGTTEYIPTNYNDLYSIWIVTENMFPKIFQTNDYCMFNYDSLYTVWVVDGVNTPYTYSIYPLTFSYDNIYTPWKFDTDSKSYPVVQLLRTLGAFSHSLNLKSIDIPNTVQSIGTYAFTHTLLNSVTISNNCDYSETSFPQNCTIIIKQ